MSLPQHDQPNLHDIQEPEEERTIPQEEEQKVVTPVTRTAPKKWLSPVQIGVIAGTVLIIGGIMLPRHPKPAPVTTAPVPTPVIPAQTQQIQPQAVQPAPVAVNPAGQTPTTAPASMSPANTAQKTQAAVKPGSTGGKKVITKEKSDLADLSNSTIDPIRNPFLSKTGTAGSVTLPGVQAGTVSVTATNQAAPAIVRATPAQTMEESATPITVVPARRQTIQAAPIPRYTPPKTTAPTVVVQATPVPLPTIRPARIVPPSATQPIVIRAVPATQSPVTQTPSSPVILTPAPKTGNSTPAAPRPVSIQTPGTAAPSTPVLNPVEQWIQEQHISYGGKASSDGNTTAIVQAPSGPVFVEVGNVIPGTQITVKSATNSSLTLSDGKTQARLDLPQ